MRFAVTIISPPTNRHAEATREVAESIHFGLMALGHDSILSTRTDNPDRRHVILSGNLLPGYSRPLAPDSILYNLEQVSPDSPWFPPAMLDLFRQYQVWDYSRRNIEALAHLGIGGVRHLPIGYVPQLTRIRPLPDEIDVFFYGSINDRRHRVLSALQARGVKVHAGFGIYGPQRDLLIARSRIILNMHFYEAKVFEAVRVSYLLANRRFVVSERGGDASEEADWTGGVAFGDYNQLADVCVNYLRHPEERQRIADAGHNLMLRRDMCAYLRPLIE